MTGLQIFTLFHVIISLVGIVAGLIAAAGMTKSKACRKMTAIFLITTIATSVTGFMFPFKGFTPAIGTGIISMLALPIAVAAFYNKKLAGKWRVTYVVTAMFSLYLNCFVLVVQSFMKAVAIDNTAPPSGPAFGAVQGAVLIGFIIWTVMNVKKFHPEKSQA